MISACFRATAVSLALSAVELPRAVQMLTTLPLLKPEKPNSSLETVWNFVPVTKMRPERSVSLRP
jgi:hypothetical protein